MSPWDHQIRNFTCIIQGLLKHIEQAKSVEEILKHISMISHRCKGTEFELMKHAKSVWDGDTQGDNEHTE